MAFTASIVAFYAGLLVVIMIHELGHYLTARAFGFKVEEYFVGFGPRLWSFRRGEIEYGVKAIPLGGYVKIAGMDPFKAVAPQDLPRSYGAKPVWQRAIVIGAGPVSHFLVAYLLFVVWLVAFGDPSVGTPYVSSVDPTMNGRISPAARAGIEPGDVVLAVDEIEDPTPIELFRYIDDHVGRSITLTLDRDGRVLQVSVTPELDRVDGEEFGRIGIFRDVIPKRESLPAAFVVGTRHLGSSVAASVDQIIMLPEGIGRVFNAVFTGAERTEKDPQSVVGIGKVVGEVGQRGGPGDVLELFTYVVVFVGILNLIPLPPFDGGHLALLAIEKVRGRAVDMRRVIPVAALVMTVFATFVFAAIVLDIVRPIDLGA